jgi:hypothetical protein
MHRFAKGAMRDKTMPYFVYKITKGSSGKVKGLDRLDGFEAYKDAKHYARELRAQGTDERILIKLIFADNEAEAEARLSQVREEPILKEWEK